MKYISIFSLVFALAIAASAMMAQAESSLRIPSPEVYDDVGKTTKHGKAQRKLNLSMNDCFQEFSGCSVVAANEKAGSAELYPKMVQCAIKVNICMASAYKNYAQETAGINY